MNQSSNKYRIKKQLRLDKHKVAEEKLNNIKTILLKNKDNSITTSNIFGYELNEQNELIKI